MKAADADGEASLEERAGNVDRSRKLIGLHADEANKRLAAAFRDHPDDFVGPHAAVGFVIGVDLDCDIRAKDAVALRVQRQAVQAGQRVGGNSRSKPLDGIAVIIIVSRLDKHDMEFALRYQGHPIPLHAQCTQIAPATAGSA